ncbi:hypothetical protein [Pleionea sp. CnH1-48]|uniref:hypothetical protein n=1 Tax=Pleionea sp. CnH1-48 TaxID=2954494 RepID=UPI0020982AA8|nr:hypothetical protein [Pleionea sp. CnH1-48]MCO7227467.1 hypothetical protein [Pleionea sp. CnH1-48]
MKIILLSLIVLLITACASGPYSIIDGSRSVASDSKNYDVYVTAVDGKTSLNVTKVKKVEPGFRVLELTSAKENPNGYLFSLPFSFEAKPCIRYVVTAQHRSNIQADARRWQVRVLREEPIAVCQKETNQ